MAPIKPRDPWDPFDPFERAFDKFEDAFDKVDSAFDKIDDLFDGVTYDKGISKLKLKLEELKKKQASRPTPPPGRVDGLKHSRDEVERIFQRRKESLDRRSKRAIRNIIVFATLFTFIFIAIIMGGFLGNKKEATPPPLVETSAPLNPTLGEKPTNDIPKLELK